MKFYATEISDFKFKKTQNEAVIKSRVITKSISLRLLGRIFCELNLSRLMIPVHLQHNLKIESTSLALSISCSDGIWKQPNDKFL